MQGTRVTPQVAAEELGMDVLTVRGLMQQGKLDIGYALKKEGKSKWSYYIYRKLLDETKERLGICDNNDSGQEVKEK